MAVYAPLFIYSTGATPTTMIRGGTTYHIISDHLGSPRLVVDSTGSVVRQLDYDSYGNVINDTNPGFDLVFGFAGGMSDSDHEFIRFGARDYQPSTERWTAKDPILFAGRVLNLYSYVSGNPINLVDKNGLVGSIPGGWLPPIQPQTKQSQTNNAPQPSGCDSNGNLKEPDPNTPNENVNRKLTNVWNAFQGVALAHQIRLGQVDPNRLSGLQVVQLEAALGVLHGANRVVEAGKTTATATLVVGLTMTGVGALYETILTFPVWAPVFVTAL